VRLTGNRERQKPLFPYFFVAGWAAGLYSPLSWILSLTCWSLMNNKN
jgi:hypothetical protein